MPRKRGNEGQISEYIAGKGRRNPKIPWPIALVSSEAVRHLNRLSIPIETGGAVPRTLGRSNEVRSELRRGTAESIPNGKYLGAGAEPLIFHAEE